MSGSIDNFFKAFDEAKLRYKNIKYALLYDTYWHMSLEINDKVLFDIRGMETETIFNTAAHKLLEYIRR